MIANFNLPLLNASILEAIYSAYSVKFQRKGLDLRSEPFLPVFVAVEYKKQSAVSVRGSALNFLC